MKAIFSGMAMSALLAAGTCAATESTQSTTESPTYFIKQPVIGSMLSRPVVSGIIPFDKTYGDLTPDQKTVLRQEYQSLGADDEPPFPQHALKRLVTPIFKEAGADHVDGKLEAAVEVDSTGSARTVSIYKSPDPKISQIATAELMQEQYKPARCKGQPCDMTFILKIDLLKPEYADARR